MLAHVCRYFEVKGMIVLTELVHVGSCGKPKTKPYGGFLKRGYSQIIELDDGKIYRKPRSIWWSKPMGFRLRFSKQNQSIDQIKSLNFFSIETHGGDWGSCPISIRLVRLENFPSSINVNSPQRSPRNKPQIYHVLVLMENGKEKDPAYFMMWEPYHTWVCFWIVFFRFFQSESWHQ